MAQPTEMSMQNHEVKENIIGFDYQGKTLTTGKQNLGAVTLSCLPKHEKPDKIKFPPSGVWESS